AVLLLQVAQLLDVGRFQLAEPLAPHVQGLLADAVLLGHLRDRRLVGLAQALDHLLFGESGLSHGLLPCSSHPLKFGLVRKSPGRSPLHPLNERSLRESRGDSRTEAYITSLRDINRLNLKPKT